MLLLAKVADATHIVGGEIYYDNLGGNNYRITMKVYRDCLNGVPPFDNPAFMTIFRADGTVYTTLNVPLTSSLTVPASNNAPLCNPGTNGSACVEESIYTTTINLPPLLGGYTIAYQRCCRNGTILNLIQPGDVGATYWEHIPGPEVVAVNSSPRFVNRPDIFICQGFNIKFWHNATDPDGDVLVYSLCTPFNGLSTCCPMIGTSSGGAGCPGVCPVNNTPPPYVSVPFASGYSASNPMATTSASTAININPTTGFLNGVPSIIGQWVVGICVSEYRAGVLIGTHHRDFQFNVIACPGLEQAKIEKQETTNNGAGTGYCNGMEVKFINRSLDNLLNPDKYHWDFGVQGISSDTSSAFQPTYVYTTPGSYTVTLIRNYGTPCADTITEQFSVHPELKPEIITPNAQCIKDNSYLFTTNNKYQGNGTFSWNFGSNANPNTATTPTVSSVIYNTAGTFTVSFTVAENGCTATAYDTITVYPATKAAIGNFKGVGCDPYTITFPNISEGVTLNYFWEFSDGTTSTEQSPTHIFTPPGVYSVSLTAIASQFCQDTSNLVSLNSIIVNPTPLASFIGTPTLTTIFDPDIAFINTAVSEGIVSWNYNFGDGGSSSLVNPFHTYTTWNDFYVTQTVVNTYNCPNTARLLIRILPEFRFWVPNAFTPWNNDGLNDVFKPKVIGVEDYTFTIFDRWGTQVFTTNDQTQGWNGTFKHEDCTDDVYVWKCDFKNVVSQKNEYHIGHVMLVR